MKTRSLALWLSIPLLLCALAAGAQNTVEVEAGYRWTDVEGNEDLYRTQINEQDGFLIRSLTFFSRDLDGANRGIVDHFRVDATDLGSGPSSAFRIEAGKAQAYRLRLGYRHFDVFSALPNFANPFLAQGVVPGQHTWDRQRTMFDADLELLSFGGRFTPFIGYTYAKYDGPGTTTYRLGGDEFRLDSDLDESEQEFRVGTTFEVGPFFGSAAQGWREVDGTELLTLSEGASAGNNPGPVLGRPISSGGITRRGEFEGRTPYTNFYVATQPTARIRLVASYVRTSADADSSETESSSGTFVSFPLAGFFTGLDETVTSDAENNTWRGDVRFEMHATDRIAILAGYRRESRELGGSAVINSLFNDLVNFGGVTEGDIREIVDARSSLDRGFDEVEAGANYRPFDALTLRLNVSRTEQEIEISPDLSEISVPGNQSGTFDRSVNAINASAQFVQPLLSLSASYRTEDADRPVVRTDFIDRTRMRGRLAFHTPGRLVTVGLSGQEMKQDNDGPDFGFKSDVTEYTIDAEVAPRSMFRLRGAYSQLKLDSSVTIRRPETFALDTSVHAEDWSALELGFALVGPKMSFDASAARLENEGSLPYSGNRYRARATYDFVKNFGVAGEWAQDEYDQEPAVSWGSFRGTRYGLFLRYRP